LINSILDAFKVKSRSEALRVIGRFSSQKKLSGGYLKEAPKTISNAA